jgi:hypothetical protein
MCSPGFSPWRAGTEAVVTALAVGASSATVAVVEVDAAGSASCSLAVAVGARVVPFGSARWHPGRTASARR